jgi:UDP-galactose transporter B1
MAVGFLQVIGQVSIYYVIANFKQHVFPLIATTRKIITVLLSIFIFSHTINTWQWVAITIVFFGMFYELYEEITHEKHLD